MHVDDAPTTTESRDGTGAGDHDQAFTFGHQPSADWSMPFTPIQFGRLLLLRGWARDAGCAPLRPELPLPEAA